MGMAASVGFTAGPALAGVLAIESDPYTWPVVAIARPYRAEPAG